MRLEDIFPIDIFSWDFFPKHILKQKIFFLPDCTILGWLFYGKYMDRKNVIGKKSQEIMLYNRMMSC